MMTLLFALFFAAICVAWRGYLTTAYWIFGIALTLAVVWYDHHATSSLGIVL